MQQFPRRLEFIIFIVFFGAVLIAADHANAQISMVPPGNRFAIQPAIPDSSVSRTRASKDSFQGKYEKVRELIGADKQLQMAIKKSAARFGIAPIHLVGALVGEHTYNVDALDRFQTYFVKAAAYFESIINFAYDGENVMDFVSRPQFARCQIFTSSYELWDCRENIWLSDFAGKNIDGKTWPNDRFGRVFFQPFYAGQTFGLGQLNPLTALKVDDLVHQTTGRRVLSAKQASKVYEAIMDPEATLDYMAAIIRLSIDSYREIAGVDISANPGITATLYNVGGVVDRAKNLRAKRLSDPTALPEENYYGWWVNEKLPELQELVR